MKLFSRRVSGLILAATLAASFLTVAPAAAATKTLASGVASKYISASTNFYSSDIGRCLVSTLSGTVKANWAKIQMVPSYTNGYSTAIYYSLYAPKLYSPRLVVFVYNKCGSGRVPKNLTQLEFRQSYYTTVCTANTSIGLSAATGWSVGLSVTPSCGKVKAASRRSISGTVTSVYSQSNTGTIVTWPELEKTATTSSGAAAMKACIDPYVYVGAEVSGHLDNSDVNFDKQCVSYPS